MRDLSTVLGTAPASALVRERPSPAAELGGGARGGAGALTRRNLAALLGGTLAALALPRVARATPGDSGEWSAVHAWPKVGIHLHVLPDGKVLTYSDDDSKLGTTTANSSKAYVVDIPSGGAPAAVLDRPNNNTNLFCAGHAFLPDGRLLVVGGQEIGYYRGVATATLFDHAAGHSWQEVVGGNMMAPRWYPTVITLANGEVLALGGTMYAAGDKNKIPEIWRTSGGWRALTSAVQAVPPYAWAFQAPNGKVFMAGPVGATRWLDTAGAGKWTKGPARRQADRANGVAVLYDKGKILAVGGGGTATGTAETLDLLAPKPAWQATGSMRFARRYHHATVLPDGTVLVTGGGRAQDDVTQAEMTAELWSPATGAWTTMASMSVARVYHSAAVLLQDGRVLTAGGGRRRKGVDQENAQIFSPPYLFRGRRPTIAAAPGSVAYGQTFSVETPDAASIAKVSLIKLSSVTHSFNMGQRFSWLPFSKGTGGLSVSAPADRNLAPPGHYMLFVLDGAGVPSVAKIIQIL